jgi:oligopeptide/dipeptide ABC transporter ATP-binding protein
MSLLAVEDLHVEFRTALGTARAVNGVSFAVAPGEALGIVGESGSGKSVTALAVLRLLPAPAGRVTRGSIVLEGAGDLLALSGEQMRRLRGPTIGMVFQDPLSALNPALTIGQQLEEGPRVHLGLTPRQARAHALDTLNLVGIPDAQQRLGAYPHQLSGGMRQRAMIAQAIVCHPKLLIADEPTTALDVTIQAQILDLVRRLQRELGLAILWISHDLGVVAGLCDRAVVMYAGRVVEEAPIDPLFEGPRHPYTRALLRSVPPIDGPPPRRLDAVPGTPPNVYAATAGCAFAPRCAHAETACGAAMPELRPFGLGHAARCIRAA